MLEEFDSVERIRKVLVGLNVVMDLFGVVRVSDFHIFSGKPTSGRDLKYGWTELPLEEIKIHEMGGTKFYLELPEPKEL